MHYRHCQFCRLNSSARLTLALLVVIAGCKTYGEVSPAAYELAKAAYSACNRESASGLERLADLIAEYESANEISADEATWLREIVETARSGEWSEAADAARQILDEQVRR